MSTELEREQANGALDVLGASCVTAEHCESNNPITESRRVAHPPDAIEADLPALWLQRQLNPHDAPTQESLLAAYMGLAEREVARLAARIPRHIDKQDLRLAALEALYLALLNFNQELGTSFEGYARKRIRGALIDMLRNQDGVPRNYRRATRRLESAAQNFRNRNARGPSEEELAGELNVSPDELHRLEFQSRAAGRLSLDAQTGADSNESGFRDGSIMSSLGLQDNPLEKMIDTETREALVVALQALPERERAILVLHYYEGIRFNEIAAAMSVSEPRISQLHSMALQRMREHLTRQRACQTLAKAG